MTVFLKGDVLEVVSPLDDEGDRIEGMLLGDLCIMLDRTSECRDWIIVKRLRDGREKQLHKGMFAKREDV